MRAKLVRSRYFIRTVGFPLFESSWSWIVFEWKCCNDIVMENDDPPA